MCFAGHTYAITSEIKKLTQKIEINNEETSQIAETKTKLHEAAEALRQSHINDLELATLLSDKWVELDKIEKENIIENTEFTKKIDNLQTKYLGTFELTAYCYGNITATGTTPKVNHTIAVDPRVIPYGSKVHIEGYGDFVAEDTGGVIKGNIIDIYMGSYEECMQFGRRKADVYLIE